MTSSLSLPAADNSHTVGGALAGAASRSAGSFVDHRTHERHSAIDDELIEESACDRQADGLGRVVESVPVHAKGMPHAA